MKSPANAIKKSYMQFKSDLKTARGMWSLAAGLRHFFRESVTVARAKTEIKDALEKREERFTNLARRHIFGIADSPYRKLLNEAGCEFGDLERLVRTHGLEKSLQQLAAEGVYLTSDEFKGKKAVVRGRRSFWVSPEDFERSDNPWGFTIQSSGTVNRPIRSQSRLDYLAARTFITGLFFSAHDLFSRSHAMYDAILPGAGGVSNLLIYAKLGIVPQRWFARKIPVNNWLEGKVHSSTTYLIVLMGKSFGPGFPAPEMIDITDLQRIVRWVVDENKNGKACCITTAASNATRIARTAWKMGISLKGAKFVVSGEPFTENKRALIERVGASGTPRYAYGGGASVGFGCANPSVGDDVHVDQTRIALISHPASLHEGEPAIHPLL